nr:HD-GYP domain-containing protein [Halorhodospira abdelmalekii]
MVGKTKYQVRTLGIAGFLHDIGKVRVPSEILQKPSALTEGEYEEIKKHSTHGYQILTETPGIPETALKVARLHHERIDGGGYPDALPESKIPFEARLAAIVDVYDALTAVRCYKDGMTPTQALKRIMADAGTKFDQNLFKRFIKCIGVYPPGSIVRLSNGKIGVVENVSRENSAKPLVRVVYDAERQEYIDPPRLVHVSREPGLSVLSSESLTDWGFLEKRLHEFEEAERGLPA